MNRRKIDLGRLLLVLATRSIVLSNTQYSLLLEEEGKFLTLGMEWIGSLVRYEQQCLCYSVLMNFNDPDLSYTNEFGTNNDKCEYFVNAFINNDRLFLQNIVFDTTFEITFDLGKDKLAYSTENSSKI